MSTLLNRACIDPPKARNVVNEAVSKYRALQELVEHNGAVDDVVLVALSQNVLVLVAIGKKNHADE